MPKGSRSQAKVGRWVAKSVHAGIEGFAFLWTVSGKSSGLPALFNISVRTPQARSTVFSSRSSRLDMIPVQASGFFWQQTALCCATTWDPGAQLLWLPAALLHALLASLHMYWRPRRRCAVLGS